MHGVKLVRWIKGLEIVTDWVVLSMANILLIEDEELLRRVIVNALSHVGHTVREAKNGRNAIQYWQKEPPDLLITDIFMPDGDGLETIMALRRTNVATPIIAISGHSGDSGHYLKVAQSLGAQRTLAKPFSVDELLVAVADILADPVQRAKIEVS